MKKIFKLMLSLFLLSSCSVSTNRKYKLNYSSDYQEVCEEGLLKISDTNAIYNQNMLPIGFSGAHPSKGIYEIGGHCGDENQEMINPLSFHLTNQYGTSIIFSIAFKNNPINFPVNKLMNELGVEISRKNTDSSDITERYFKEASSLKDIYVQSGSNYYVGMNNGRYSTFIYSPCNLLGISYKMYPGEEINYIKFYYGDIPQDVVNAAIFLASGSDLSKGGLDKYDGSDCSRTSYSTSLGSHYEFDIVSQYGTVYSKDYLLSKFIAVDKEDSTSDHVSLIDDPDNYFLVGHKAKIGTTFKVTIYAIDSESNRSDLIFNFIVKDLLAPVITPLFQDEITVSYKEKLNEAFINKHFFIADNYDETTINEIVKKDGSKINNIETGKIECKLISKDSFNNKSEYNFTIKRIDDIPPVISCKYDELNLSTETILTQDNLLSFFSIEDEMDKNPELYVESNSYSKHSKELGYYTFIVTGKDKSGNTSSLSLSIYVLNSNGPIFYTNQSFLTFARGNAPSEEEIISSLIRRNILPNKKYVSSNVIDGENIDNNLEVGEHLITMQYIADDNSSYLVDLLIEVVENDKLGIKDDDITNESLSWWQKFCNWWVKLFNKIKSFFTGS